MRYILSFTLLLISLVVFPQFRLAAPLDSVKQSGYYNIELPPEIEALSEISDWGDLRIKNSDESEVPYFVHNETPIRTVSNFVDFHLIENKTKDSLNILVIDNLDNIKSATQLVDRFCVLVNNADVSKFVSVRGSNDLSQWYVVKQHSPVSGVVSEYSKGVEMLYVDMPAINYRYYEITLSNTQSSPLKVQRVGRINNSNIYGRFSRIDFGTMVRKDSTDQYTYLRFPDMPFEYHIGKIEFYIHSKSDYQRTCYVKDLGYATNLTLSSRNGNVFILDNFVASKKMEIGVYNADNRPLQIDSIRMYVLNRYICAYLEEGQRYRLYVGSKKVKKPNYDIEHFRQDIPDNLPVLKVSKIDIMEDESSLLGEARTPSLIEKPIFMWSVIIIVGLLLLFICFKMASDMKKNKK